MTPDTALGRDALAGLVDAAPDALLVLDQEGRVRYVNRQLETLTGWSRTELLGELVERLLPERFRARHVLLRDAFVAAPRPRAMGVGRLLFLRRRDGEHVPVEIGLSPGRAEGEPVVLVAIRDVSERRRAQAAESLVGQALDVIDDGVVVLDAETGERVYANRAVLDRSGYGPAELTGVRLGAPSTPAEEAALQRAVREVVTGAARRVVLDTHVGRRDGTRVPVETAISYVPPGPADDAGHVVLVSRDTTARVAAEARRARRAATAQLVADVATHVLGGAPLDAVYTEIADGVARVFDAGDVTLGSLRPEAAGPRARRYEPVGAHGPGHAALAAALTKDRAVARALGRHERTRMPPVPAGPAADHPLGPGAAVRFGAAARGAGVLAACRAPGAEPFTEDDVGLLAGLAQQVALAVELGRARADQERLAVLEDRERLARDLHDTVVQDVLATGMQVALVLPRVADPDVRARLEDTVERLEEAVRRLRGAVFELQEPVRGGSLAEALRAVTVSAGRVLGHEPELVVTGPVGRLTAGHADQLVATLHEALSNVLRHAHATSTRVRLAVTAHGATLTVEDDGVGPPAEGVRGDGLSNLRCRARSFGGWSLLAARHPHGARFVWHVPLPAPREPAAR